MLHDLLSEHLSTVEAVVRKLKEVYVECKVLYTFWGMIPQK
jgi:hypothetical protein